MRFNLKKYFYRPYSNILKKYFYRPYSNFIGREVLSTHCQSFKIFLFFLVSLLLCSTSIFAQKIGAIEINGLKNFSANEILNYIRINAGIAYTSGIEDTIAARIYAGLQAEGYFNSSVIVRTDRSDSSSFKIKIEIDEKEPTYIRSVNFKYAGADSLLAAARIKELEGKILSSSQIGPLFSSLFDHFEKTGFPFASIKINSVYFLPADEEGHGAVLYIEIDEGFKSRIDKIEIEGNNKTKNDVIIRATGIVLGENYNQEKIDEVANSLNRLRFFEPVEEPAFYINSAGLGVLKIKVTEKETNSFDGILGYLPGRTANEKGTVSGFVNIGLRNLFGTGRAASFKWMQESRTSQELEIKYLEPWIFGLPFSLSGSLYQRKQDSTYVKRSFGASIDFIATAEITAGFTFGSESTIPTERTNKIFTVFNSTSNSYGVSLRINTKDDFYNPTKGFELINSYRYSSKKISGPKEFITPDTETEMGLQRIELDFSFYYEILRGQVATIGVHGRELRGSNVEISDLYLLGGTNTLRGYREKQFAGNRIFWSNLEYRYLLSKRSFAFVFFDTGYFMQNEDKKKGISRVTEFLTGYGFGINIDTALGVLGVSFALGKGDSFTDGKIHFGIVNEF